MIERLKWSLNNGNNCFISRIRCKQPSLFTMGKIDIEVSESVGILQNGDISVGVKGHI